MFCVAAVEIVTAECAGAEAAIATKAAMAVPFRIIFLPPLLVLMAYAGIRESRSYDLDNTR
jgi:hypothetical protein